MKQEDRKRVWVDPFQTRLTMRIAAYLVLFLPVVVAARWVETRFAWKR